MVRKAILLVNKIWRRAQHGGLVILYALPRYVYEMKLFVEKYTNKLTYITYIYSCLFKKKFSLNLF